MLKLVIMELFRGKVITVGFAALSFLLAMAIMGTSCTAEAEAKPKLGVIVSILPQVEFAERIGGDKVTVTVMVPPGASPHTYEPTPSQLAALSEAELYAKVGSGVEFELVWLAKLIAQNEDILLLNCAQGIQLQPMVTSDNQEQLDNEHGAGDPHIWMSPRSAQVMVQNLADGLIQVDPVNQTYYEQHRDDYLQKLRELDQEISDGLAGMKNRTFMVYHPSFGYFASDYGLTMLPIESEGKEPTAAGIQHLIEQAAEDNIRVIFVEPQFNPQSAQVIADEINGEVIFVDPLAQDYLNNMHSIAEKMIAAME